MFTGIVEEVGTVAIVRNLGQSCQLLIRGKVVPSDARTGDSVCVSGACLTVTRVEGDAFWTEAVAETLSRTTLGGLRVGAPVNLERSVTPATRLGGHFVTGHVDGVGTVAGLRHEGTSARMTVACSPDLAPMIAQKGSIAVDGVSLTVAEAESDRFSVALIPHTLEVTTLGKLREGDSVNLETDMMAKYLLRLLQTVDLSNLRRAGPRADVFATWGKE